MNTQIPWPNEIIDLSRDQLPHTLFQLASALNAVVTEYLEDPHVRYTDCVSRAFYWIGRTEVITEVINDDTQLMEILKTILSQLFALNDTINKPAVINELTNLHTLLMEMYTRYEIHVD